MEGTKTETGAIEVLVLLVAAVPFCDTGNRLQRRFQTAMLLRVNPRFRPVIVMTSACATKDTTMMPTLGLA